MSDYVLFNNKDNTHDNRRLRGSRASGGSGGSGGLGGWADNSAFNRLDNYSTYGKHEKLQEREINRNSEGIKENYKLYTTENIIKIDNNNNNNNNNSINSNSMTGTSMNGNDSFVAGEVVYQTIVIPFYICLMDIIIFNDLFIEVVDNSSIETKNNVLISGKIRKYRLNGVMKNYDIFIEMENEDVFHVKKRGIMMRVRLSEELRKLIINTMVNYVADGGEIDAKSKAVGGAGRIGRAGSAASSLPVDTRDSRTGGGGSGGRGGGGGGVFSCFGCFKSRHD